MGQSQSSGGAGGGSRGGGGEVKTSYYVLLGIERNATEEEIKKAYRRKALELHPDRNYGNEEAATKTFAEIQAAHEVLSDPQERAWYDSHESAILRGDDATTDAPTYEDVRVTTADDIARLVSKFNRNVEFSDAPSGFYGFVRETFEQLAKEEDIASSWEDVEVREYPTFGHKDDEYGDVVKQFYAAWSGFSTVKSFSWRDKYRLSDAPDRWIRRRMEQENLKLRKDGKQEFNEAVRSLVQFIKKRDPRFVPNTQSEAERQKALRDAAAAQAARARAANAAKLAEQAVPEWTKARDPEELEESSEEEVEELHFECVACNKVFKSERQWEAHEKSKKHQKAVKELQKRMRKQNAHLNLDESGTDSGAVTPDLEDEEQEVLDDLAAEVEDHEDYADGASEKAEDDIDDAAFATDAEKHEVDVPKDDADQGPREDHEPSTTVPEMEANEVEEASNSENEDYASMSTIQARMRSAALDTPASTVASTAASEDNSGPAKPKMGKAALKRAKKAAAADAQAAAGHKCQVCNEEFPSRTKLFQHVEEEGHAALKDAKPGNAKGKKGKGKG
ncbi:DnaJ subfamily C member 21 [Fulvia fulva]|uniref:DnaJ subfamily C member 21 n=1 Tax=Passalora fulva TaxID=5499 RepID=A0A9Q8UVJ0_PASFU|nr:DnaJ subfamily C member 21 [Fulvia fulva]KAK4611635.1 DnaJ subfamily C member 21 [Fulvia fulva]UJO24008.1 DnaJ subfamily C member 21 [Fulvia fulva]WPV20874.1 DnaJ subfamily C member 21 [Fulvia fulva]WPV36102.1 DnaJ subfamily C member 21 [Fulvia fulva]